MNNSRITIRSAQREDAEAIAHAVALAIGDETALHNYCGQEYMSVLSNIARHESTQYSWQNALVAEVDGIRAGATVGYNGAQLIELREGTFAVLREQIGRVPNIVDETQAGEYYLDSVGVFPQFRGLGVGCRLVSALCEKAFSEGYERVGLIVNKNNPQAEKLYTSLGFEHVGTRIFFGQQMWHLQKKKQVSNG